MSLYLGNNLIAPNQSNAANKSLSNLDATGQAVIDGKADVDLSNVNPNQTFIDTSMAWCGMDGSREISLGVPSSGSPYTLPSAGYIVWVSYNGGVADRYMYYSTPNMNGTYHTIHMAVGYEFTYITPLFPKGTLVYGGANTTAMYFVPAEGSN